MIRHPKRKNAAYYLKRIAIVAAVVAVAWKIPAFYRSFGHIDVAGILEESVLKNRRFAVKVQEIESGSLKAFLLEEHSNPIVSISFVFKNAGSAHDPENRQGLANLAAMLLTDGAGEFSEVAFKETAEENGVKIGFSVSADDFSGGWAYPKANQETAVRLFQAALTQPHLAEKYLALAQEQGLTALQLVSENPKLVLNDKFNADIYAGHPYARSDLGRAEGIKATTTADIRQYLQNSLAQDNLIIGIAGDITPEESVSLLQQLFGNLPPKSKVAALEKVEFSADGVEYNAEGAAPQALTRFAAAGTYRDSVDFYPLYLANYILGESGLNSRLSKRIREKEGLTYGIYTYLSISDAAALVEGNFSATPANFAKAQQILKEEWLKLGKKGVSAAELAEAKKSLINSFYLRFASIRRISAMLVSMQEYNLGMDFLEKRNEYINEVSLKEVNAAAKKYFSSIPDFVNIGAENSEEE